MKKLRILHIFNDSIFCNNVFDYFDSFDNVTNLFYFYINNKNYEFKNVKPRKNLKIIDDKKKYFELLSSKQIDAIFFHGMPIYRYTLFKYIDKTKIVFLWSWGYDIYIPYGICKALIPITLYKKRTYAEVVKTKYILNSFSIKRKLYDFRNFIFILLYKKKIFRRIDYYTPVLSIENKLIRQNKFFHAEPFGLSVISSPGFYWDNYVKNQKKGNILIGNSLSYDNNHLDIFETVKSIDTQNRKYIIPISYGEDYQSKEHFMNISELPDDKVIWLKEFLTKEEYREIYKSISFAIFGHLRQQAVGNIIECFLHGIKVFFYKDSINYLNFKKNGFYVFSIEDDLNENELKTPLCDDYAQVNFNLLGKYEKEKIMITQNQINQIISETRKN